MDQKNTYDYLLEFRDLVIKQAKDNLAQQGKNSSGNLSESINIDVKVMENSIGIYVDMEDYGKFVDQGVNGKFSAYATPYSFKNKMPPPSKLDKWIVRRGIAPRDENGKLLPRKILQFLIARSIFRNGIKPSLFFTKAFEEAYKILPDELIDKYGLDAEGLLLEALDQVIRKIESNG